MSKAPRDDASSVGSKHVVVALITLLLLTTSLEAGVGLWHGFSQGPAKPPTSVILDRSTVDPSTGPADAQQATSQPPYAPPPAQQLPSGNGPIGAVYDSGNGNVYVANSGSSNLTVLNASTGKVVGSVSIPGILAFREAYDSGNGYVYVTDASGGGTAVWVVDGITNTLVGSVPVGSNPHGIAFDPSNGRLFVANLFSNNVTVIDGLTDSVVATVPVGSSPDGVAFDPANGEVYVTNDGSGTVSVINASSDTLTTTIHVGSLFTCCIQGSGVAFDPLGGLILVSNDGSNNVSIIDGSSNHVVRSANVDQSPFGLVATTFEGNAYVPNEGSSDVSVLQPSTGLTIGSIATLNNPTDIVYAAPEDAIFITEEGASSVLRVNLTAPAVSASFWQGSFFGNASCSYNASAGPPSVSGSPNLSISMVDYAPGTPNWWVFGSSPFTAELAATLETPVTGEYSFQLSSDDGSALFVDGSPVDHTPGGWCAGAGSGTGSTVLAAGMHSLQLAYFENGGLSGASISLDWMTPGSGRFVPIPPEAFNNSLNPQSFGPFNVSVVVTDNTGMPLTNASVSVAGSAVGLTNSSGVVALTLFAGSYAIGASAPSHVSESREVNVASNITVDLTSAIAYTFVGPIPPSHLNITLRSDGYRIALLPMTTNSTEDVDFDWQAAGTLGGNASWTTFDTRGLPSLVVMGAAIGSPAFPDAWFASTANLTLPATTNTSGAFLAEPVPYVAGSISVDPDPPTEGVPTLITVTLHNPNLTGSLTISRIDFEVGGLSVAAPGYSVVGDIANVSLAPGQVENFSVQWVPNITGHHCIRIVVVYPGDPPSQELQRNYNFFGPIPSGCGGGMTFHAGDPLPVAAQEAFHLQVVPADTVITLTPTPPPGFLNGLMCGGAIAKFLKFISTSAPGSEPGCDCIAVAGVRGAPRPSTSDPSGYAPPLGGVISFAGGSAGESANGTFYLAPGQNQTMYLTVYPKVPGPRTVDVQGSINGSLVGGVRFGFTALPPDQFGINFTESGLPAGVPWKVSVSHAATYGSTNTSVQFSELNGTYPYSVACPGAFVAQVPNGTFNVTGGNTSVFVHFVPAYTLTVHAFGLPAGWPWTFELVDGPNFTTRGSSLTLGVRNGSTDLVIPGDSWYASSPSSLHVLVDGANVTANVSFVPVPTTSITIAEAGLLAGTQWGIAVGVPSLAYATSGRSMHVLSPLGAVHLGVRPPANYGVALLSGRSVIAPDQVNASPLAVVTVHFGPMERVNFSMSNLSRFEPYSGARWGVSLTPASARGGPAPANATTTTTGISFLLPASAAYHYTLTTPGTEYKATPARGSFIVPHHTLLKTVKFVLLTESVRFVETGTHRNVGWTVWIAGGNTPALHFPFNGTSALGRPVVFRLPLGNFTFYITGLGNQTAVPSTGTVLVSAAPSPAKVVDVAF